MKLLLEYKDGFNCIQEFTEINFAKSIHDISISITKDGIGEWLYCYHTKTLKDREIVKAHYQKIINQLLELDYVKMSDFPIKEVKGDFFDDYQLN